MFSESEEISPSLFVRYLLSVSLFPGLVPDISDRIRSSLGICRSDIFSVSTVFHLLGFPGSLITHSDVIPSGVTGGEEQNVTLIVLIRFNS